MALSSLARIFTTSSLLIRGLDHQKLHLTRNASIIKRIFQGKEEAKDSADQEISQMSNELVQAEYTETPLPALPKSYNPLGNVEATVISLARRYTTEDVNVDTEISCNLFKYKVLTACVEEFQYDIPSYELGDLRTIADLVNYYTQERKPTTPEERLKNADVPKNVHMDFEPYRFTEDTKDDFGGKTAFPQRDTVVTSLKYRHIYKGYENEKVYKKKDGFHYF